MSLFTREEPAPPDDGEVIQLGALAQRRRRGGTRWGLMLVAVMRIIAGFWLALGLLRWADIILPGSAPIDALPGDVAFAIIALAVADLVAAVGLWLATPWGGALWVATVLGETFALLYFPAYFSGGMLLLAIFLMLLAVYFVATWRAAHERRMR